MFLSCWLYVVLDDVSMPVRMLGTYQSSKVRYWLSFTLSRPSSWEIAAGSDGIARIIGR